MNTQNTINTITLDEMYKPTDTLAYLYPSAGNSDFFNTVPETFENTVSGRTMAITQWVKQLVFDVACSPDVVDLLKACGTDVSTQNIISLDINQELKWQMREKAVIKRILELYDQNIIAKNSLIGGQPIPDIPSELYAIDPKVTSWFNDKSNLKSWIPEENLPMTYCEMDNGKELQDVNADMIIFPCRAKIVSSSAGDGVRLLENKQELESLKQEREKIGITILFQENIEAEQDLGIYFGLAPDGSYKIYGAVEPNTDKQWASFGASITNNSLCIDPEIKELFEQYIIPKLKKEGKYGIGSLDILKDKKSGKRKVIDPNIRFSANIWFLLDKLNGNIWDKSVMSFMGTFAWWRGDFESQIIPLVENKLLRVLALSSDTNNSGTEQFIVNGGILYDQIECRWENIQEIQQKTWIKSGAFTL